MSRQRIGMVVLAVAMVATPAVAPAYVTDGMVVHYTFDDPLNLAADALDHQHGTLNAGTTGVPTHSTGTQGIVTTATHVTGGGAVSFVGVNGYVAVADGTNSYLDTATGANQARTVSFWFQTSTTANQAVLEKGANQHFVVQTGAGGKPFWRTNTSGGNVYSINTAQDGTWHHFVGMHADGVNYLYIDGVYQGQTVDTAPAPNNNPLVLGARVGSVAPYDGKLDDVAIWNRKLTAAEIKLIYTGGKLGLDASQAALPYQITGVTYAYGTATSSQPTIYLDTLKTKLTDIHSTLNHTTDFVNDSAWVGFRDNTYSLQTSQPEITFDLQESVNLDEIRMIYMGGNYAGIQPPDLVWVSFSSDGDTFSTPEQYTPFSATPPPGIDISSLAVEEAFLDIGGYRARYVRLDFRNSGQWTFLGDVAFIAVPEPGSLALFAAGCLLLLAARPNTSKRRGK